MSSIWVVPDIHGRLDLLKALNATLKSRIDFSDPDTRKIYLGDMVDRGPESRGVIASIKKDCEDHPGQVLALYGNHEDLMLNGLQRDGRGKRSLWDLSDVELWKVNGGEKTILSYQGHDNELDAHVEWLKTLPLSIEYGGFFFSHAPVPREGRRAHSLRGKEFTKEELIWTYSPDEFGVARRFEGMIGVCGHIHKLRDNVLAPRFYDHYIFADAGCGCSPKAPLVAIEVRTREVVYAWPEVGFEALW